MGKVLAILGAVLLTLGLVLHFWPGAFGWFGKLPGDIRIEKGKGVVFIPLTSMILLSLALTVLVNLFFRR
jgi:hypothetical protein